MRSLLTLLLLAGCPDPGGKDSATADADGDGYGGEADCDDASAAIHPGADELCDGLDNDCSGTPDDAPTDGTVYYADSDGDGYGDDGTTATACEVPDGFAEDGEDCDDGDPSFHPGAAEADCTDPADYNCDGSVGYADADTDGFAACEDCDDTSRAVNPDATETCNEVDDDCDGETDEAGATGESTWYADTDGDTYGDAASTAVACDAPDTYVADATDCDDGRSDIHPSAAEEDCADPTDYNCDGSTGYVDDDGDGFAACEECDDGAPAVNPDAAESCNGIDDDCDGDADESGSSGSSTWYADADGDGYGDRTRTATACDAPTGYVADATDCDDTDGSIHPASVWHRDADGDGYGGETYTVTQCEEPTGYTLDGTDCDDYDAEVSPAGTEVCDGEGGDEDCDGLVDDSDGTMAAASVPAWYRDADGDGYGGASAVYVCASPGATYVTETGDCDDADAAQSPGATEVCDGGNVDEDCDGDADDADAGATNLSTWYQDADSDGYGAAAVSVEACDIPAGYVADASDCDDSTSTARPGGTEVCDTANLDEDCDGAADDADSTVSGARTTWYRDADSDGFGALGSSVSRCDLPSGYVVNGADCDDSSASISPFASEVCDGDTDEDCDGLVDDADTSVSAASRSTWYRDADGDTYGGSTTASACAAPSGYVASAGDCNDASSTIRPGGAEVCDSSNTDEDCDGLADDADSGATGKSVWYADADVDGYGVSSSTTSACDLPSGYAAVTGDCDDGASGTNPGAVERCDSADTDEDCDGYADDDDSSASAATMSNFYADTDGDGYGLSTSSRRVCDMPSGYVANATDCNDGSSAINPAATEVCDSGNTDEDCDGAADDSDSSVSNTGKITTYADTDRDGYGNPSSASARCDTSSSWVTDYTDCDDTRSAVSPAGTETCATTYDDDCDTVTNEVNAAACTNYYTDADSDGYGTGTAICECFGTGLYTATNATDCNDGASAIRPSASEVCDGVDQDCDGTIDDGMTLYYTDADADGYGDESETGSCTSFSGAVTVGLDCDDEDDAINPGEGEVCDDANTDEDCDGYADDADASATGETSWYPDDDEDGYGDDSVSATSTCDAPAGYVDDDTDCDDGDVDTNPAANEIYGDTNDEDCDGSTTPTRTYCTPNVGSGRTYSSISNAVSAGATSICLGAGSYSYSSNLQIPLYGQGIGVSYYNGDIGDNAEDVTINGDSGGYGSYSLTRVHITGDVAASCAGSWSQSVGVYESILEGGVRATATVGTSASSSCSATLYNSYITGAAYTNSSTGLDYTLYVSTNGNYVYGRRATATISCYGCTILDPDNDITGAYYAYATDYGRTYVYLYNTVYDAGTSYSYQGSNSTTSVTTANVSTSTSLLDMDYEPPRPTGALIDAGSSSYGRTTDFWGVTRSGNPDIGAVEY